MAIPTTWDKYRKLHLRLWGTPGVQPPQEKAEKKNKHGAIACVVDGIRFASKLESRCYQAYLWQYRAGLISQPLLQVRFSLGVHCGRERYYVADLVAVDLKDHTLLVVDAKGRKLKEYLQKKPVFEGYYRIRITEWTDKKRR